MDKIRIGVDMDNVITYSLGGFMKELWKRYKIPMNQSMVTEYEIQYCIPGVTTEMVKEIFSDPYTYEISVPVLTAIESLKFLNDIGYEIFILTDRPENCRDVTTRWLSRYKIPYTMVELIKAKEKSKFAKKFSLKYFVEDKLETVIDLANVCDTVFLLDYPWNQGKLPVNTRRVSGWDVVIAQMFYPTVVPL